MVPYQTDKRYFCFNLKMHSAKSLEQPSKEITEAQNNYKCIKLAKLYVPVILKLRRREVTKMAEIIFRKKL